MANELLGYGAKLKLGDVLYDVVDGEPSNERSTAPGDTTATGRKRYPVIDKESFSFSGSAIRYSTINPHDAPQRIMSASVDFVDLKYWANAADVADPTKAWRCPTFLFTHYSERFDAKLGLIVLNFKGESQGDFKRPGEA